MRSIPVYSCRFKRSWRCASLRQIRAMKSNFTLIELLVVIAIIAVLASMLLPALAQARAKAQSLKCVNNLQQLTLAVLNYTMERDDFFPHGPQFNAQKNLIYDELKEFTGVDPAKYRYRPYRERGIWACPSDSVRLSRNYSNGNPTGSYLRSVYAACDSSNPVMRKISQLKSPSKVIYWTDGMNWKYIFTNMALGVNVHPFNLSSGYENNTDSWVDFRHNGTANFGYLDGHVLPHKLQEVANQKKLLFPF